jgi:hypothetical protein
MPEFTKEQVLDKVFNYLASLDADYDERERAELLHMIATEADERADFILDNLDV